MNPKSKLLTTDYYILAHVTDASVIEKMTNWFSKTTYINVTTNKLTIPKNNIKQEINRTSKCHAHSYLEFIIQPKEFRKFTGILVPQRIGNKISIESFRFIESYNYKLYKT